MAFPDDEARIGLLGQQTFCQIALETTKKSPIANKRPILPAVYRIAEEEVPASDRLNTIKRTASDPTYNCHGLTFSSRRTTIEDASQVSLILAEEPYQEVLDLKCVLPGDIVAYYEKGSITHTGIVVANEPVGETFRRVLILSKWGGGFEAIHLVDDCTYSRTSDGRKYFRFEHKEHELWTLGSNTSTIGSLPTTQSSSPGDWSIL